MRKPRSRPAQQRVTQPRRVALERIAGADMGVEHVGERRQREVGGRRVAADQGQLEPELVEAVGSADVAQAGLTGERTERRLDRRHEPVDDGVDGTDVDPAPRQSLGERSGDRASEVGRGEVDAFEHGVDERADPRAPPGIAASGSWTDRSAGSAADPDGARPAGRSEAARP